MKWKWLGLCLQKKCSYKLADYGFIFALILFVNEAFYNASKVIVLLLMSVLLLRCLTILSHINVGVSEPNFKFDFPLFKIILLSGCLFVCFRGRPWQATDVPQPSWLFVPPALDVPTLAYRRVPHSSGGS
jgi:hypothetical protein